MRQIFIIIINPDILTLELLSRIESLGETYRHFDNIVFLSPTDDSLVNARDVYSLINSDNGVPPSLSIFRLSGTDHAFWGYASRKLWDWIKKHRQSCENK